ncbi:MAG TPA: glycosyltransferase family 39 protein [Candidatus Hydrogenedentes bacterium]|nr:glycosyltransferase family 39 protein [Candidatus Hydrogenedentota bacterium]
MPCMCRMLPTPIQSTMLAKRLLSVFSCVFFTYLFVVGVLSILGIEAIYRHPTPFYCLPKPVFSSLLEPMGLFLFFVGVWLTAWYPHLLLPIGTWKRRIVWGLVFFLVLGLIISFWQNLRHSSEGEGKFFYTIWTSVKMHLAFAFITAIFFFLIKKGFLVFSHNQESLTPKQTFCALVFFYLFVVVFSMSLAGIRGGSEGLTVAYSRQSYEYIGDIGRGLSIRGLFKDYNKMHPFLSMHSKVHPPGPVVVLWLLADLGAGRTPLGLSIATVFFGSLAVFPLYYWVRDVTDAMTAYAACLLYCLSPMAVLFTATSADILFMPFTLTALFLFWRAINGKSLWYAVGAGIVYGIMSILSFSLIGIGSFFGLVGLWKLFSRDSRKHVIRTAALMAFSFLCFHVLLWLWSGFDVFECFRLAKEQFDLDQANIDRLGPRYPSWIWKILNPACWLFFAGIPVTVLCYRFLREAKGQRKSLAWVFLLTFLALDFLYLARGEGERSAMYVLPFLLVPSATQLAFYVRQEGRLQTLAVTLCFMAFQCWFIETLFFTYW